MVRDSASRMATLIDNLLDLARGRLGGGLTLNRDANEPLEPVLRAVIAELNASQPDRVAETAFTLVEPINCDGSRIAQLFSNLLSNESFDQASYKRGFLSLTIHSEAAQLATPSVN